MNLAVEDLTCTRGGLPVIENLTFHVPAGTALILRGPNGSGKTTLLRTLAGLQPPASGTVLPGADAIAYAAHADAVKATLTVAENIAFWAGIHGHGDIGAALSAFDLERLADRLAIHLSAGQRRRLGLARLAVTGRPVWALDEPTVSLDSASVERFCGVVRDHLAAGGVAIIATHIDLGIKSKSLDIERFAALAPIDDFDAAFA